MIPSRGELAAQQVERRPQFDDVRSAAQRGGAANMRRRNSQLALRDRSARRRDRALTLHLNREA